MTIKTIEIIDAGKGQDDDMPERDKSLLSYFVSSVKQEKKNSSKYLKSIRESRKYVEGQQHGDNEDDPLVRANLIFADIKSEVNRIYAKNPEIAIEPSLAVTPERYDVVRRFSRTGEIVLNRQLRDAELKKRAKAAVRSAGTTGIGWVKVFYQIDRKLDPIASTRINDTQDNIERLRSLAREIEDPQALDENQRKVRELEDLVASIEADAEVEIAEGIVVDRVLSEHLFLDTNLIRDFDNYAESPWIAHCIPMYLSEVRSRFNIKPEDLKHFEVSKQEKTAGEPGENRNDDDGIVNVFEFWYKKTMTVYTFALGHRRWLRKPYHPKMLGEQWYPFFPFSANKVDGRFYPLSKVDLLKELQDEHNTSRTNFSEVRSNNIPHTIVRKGVFDKTDLNRMANPPRNGIVEISGQEGQPISADIIPGINPGIDPRVYDTSHIIEDFQRVTNVGDQNRGFQGKQKTATEAAIINDAVESSSSSDVDELELWLSDIAKYTFEILLQRLSVERVKEIAGDKAMWPGMVEVNSNGPLGSVLASSMVSADKPALTKEEVFDLVGIEIRAGSTGRPNKTLEQQRWVQIGPQISQLAIQISELQDSGKDDLAQALIRIMQEGIRRFDEKIDVRALLPVKDENEPPTQADIQKQQEAQKQQAIQLEQINAEIAKLKSEVARNLAMAEQAKAKAAELSTIDESEVAMNLALANQANAQAKATLNPPDATNPN